MAYSYSLKELHLATILYSMPWLWYVHDLFVLNFSSKPQAYSKQLLLFVMFLKFC